MEALDRLLRHQGGVVSRRQVLGLGGTEVLVARRLRRREWVRVHEGVFVDHTGPLSTRQREWVALLLHPGSVLAGASALRVSGLAGAGGREVEIAVPHGRRLDPAPGLRVVQVRGFDRATMLRASPPRLRVEHAALMGDVPREVGRRRGGGPRRRGARGADPARAARARARRPAAAATSRAAARGRHGLPRGERQVRVVTSQGTVARDVRYAPYLTLVELDGRIGHTAAMDRWADLGRDLEAATHGEVTLRAGWQQVLDPCRLAAQVGAVLSTRGWPGEVRRCRACSNGPEGVS